MNGQEKRMTMEELASLDEAGKMFVLGYMTGRMDKNRNAEQPFPEQNFSSEQDMTGKGWCRE